MHVHCGDDATDLQGAAETRPLREGNARGLNGAAAESGDEVQSDTLQIGSI